MRFGAHVSIADHLYLAVDRAVAIGCEAAQIFPGNPRGWRTRPFSKIETAEFIGRRREAGLWPLAIHLPYLVNLGSSSERVRQASIDSIKDSLTKAAAIEADFLVMHPGGHGGDGQAVGLERLAAGLRTVLEEDFGPIKLLLENTAGAGHTLGSTLEQIDLIMAGAENDGRLGLCFDTCHAFAAGYDIATERGLDEFFGRIRDSIGLDRLRLVHANDCKGSLGSHLDRHEHIGQGRIGLEGFRRLVAYKALANIPFIIETPKKSPEDDPRNLALLRGLKSVRRD